MYRTTLMMKSHSATKRGGKENGKGKDNTDTESFEHAQEE